MNWKIALPIVIIVIAIGFFFWYNTDTSKQAAAEGPVPVTATPDLTKNKQHEWSSDGVSMYFRDTKVPNLDVASFEIIYEGFYGECPSPPYVKDKNGVYIPKDYYGYNFSDPSKYTFIKIEGADAATFERLPGYYSRDKSFLYQSGQRTNLDPKNPTNYDTHCG